MNRKNKGMGYYLALGMMIVIGLGVMFFLGKHSLNFFTWTFTGQDEIYSYLGLLLTSIGAVGWLLDFLYLADTSLRKTVSMSMVVVSLLGELGAAGFDMYLNAIGLIDAELTQTDIRNMTLVVALLGFVHGAALVIYIVGDKLAEAWNGTDDAEPEPIPAPAIFQPQEQPRQFEQAIPAPILPHPIAQDEPTPAPVPFLKSQPE